MDDRVRHFAEHLCGDDTLADQVFRVKMARSGVCFDPGVHQRLCVAGFVTLVVPQPAKSDQVEDDVFVKRVAIIECDLDHAVGGLGVVTVDVKDRRLRDLRSVGRIDRAAAQLGRGGEPDLIIDDDMDGPACSVARKTRQLQRFHHDPLTGKCRVAVEQDRHHKVVSLFAGPLVAVSHVVLKSAGHALDHRIDEFQMARVTSELDLDLAARLCDTRADSALVIFDVALVGRKARVRTALKDRENALGHIAFFRIADDIRKNVQTAAVGHTHKDLSDAACG